MTDIANALAASSMLLAIVAVLFAFWTGDVTDAIKIEFAAKSGNRLGQRSEIRGVIFSKALPLTLGSWLTAGVFAWRAARLVLGAIDCFSTKICTYDDVGAAFVLTEVFVVLVAISATAQLCQLIWKLWNSY